MFIDGKRITSTIGKKFAVLNPCDGSVVAQVPDASPEHVELAISSAKAAFDQWKVVPVETRAQILEQCIQEMLENIDELAKLLHLELGRPLEGCIGEFQSAARLCHVYAEEALRLKAEVHLGSPSGEMTIVSRDPLGVAVAITPFNYPINLLLFKVGAAIAAGCTVVAKPSQETPLSALALAELFHKAGLPAGVFNVVTAKGSDVPKALVSHPVPRKIAFTGSVAAGKAIALASTGTLKRLTLELGGHSAAIVCEDADLDKAAQAICRHGYANSGQFCYRVNRVYVARGVYHEFIRNLSNQVSELTLGPSDNGKSGLGPLVNQVVFNNSYAQVQDAVRLGARIITGGERQTGEGFDQGYYFQPTIVADATPEMLVMREETFGPVLGISPFDTLDEARRLANDSTMGLAGFVFTKDLSTGLALGNALEVGQVWLNDIQRSSPYAPFGGMKESGLGREKGRYGVEAYLEYKTMYLSFEAKSL